MHMCNRAHEKNIMVKKFPRFFPVSISLRNAEMQEWRNKKTYHPEPEPSNTNDTVFLLLRISLMLK